MNGHKNRHYYNAVKKAPYFFTLPFVISFVLFFLYPVIYMFVMSFQKIESLESWSCVGFNNYKRLSADIHIGSAVMNSVLFTIGIVVVNIVLGVLIAVGLNNKKTLFRNGFRSAIYLPALTSIVVAGIYFRLFFAGGEATPLNRLMTLLNLPTREWLYDTRLSGIFVLVVTATWRWLGTNTLYFLCGLQAFPKELFEAADIDGANSFQKFWNIIIPGLKPILIFVGTTLVYGGLRMFGESYVLWREATRPAALGDYSSVHLQDRVYEL